MDIPSVAPDEKLARFIFQSNLIRKGRALVSLFGPRTPKGKVQPELSVYRIERAGSVNEIHPLGKQIAKDIESNTHQPKNYHGYVSLNADKILDCGLSFDPDDRPYPGHTNIIGWPEQDDDASRQRLLALKTKLCHFASIVEKPAN